MSVICNEHYLGHMNGRKSICPYCRLSELEAKLERQEAYYIGERKQLTELREALSDAADGFEGEAAGHGVDFFAYAQDIRALLKQGGE